ncbi:EthD domain-containing protein [Neobacillus vireti]|uniref:EthD domain-containing protein n=1 Tax=Neobacillus vireti TaxID=220686 RepID=UPI003000F0B9
MIKVSTVMKKNNDLSIPEFHDHWLNEHADIAMGTPSWFKYMKNYVQSHTLHALHPDHKPAYDGVAHFWVDSVESFREWSRLPELNVVAADTKKLVEQDKLIRLFTNEVEKYSTPNWEQKSKIKRISFIKKSKHIPVKEFHNHWSNYHSKLVINRTWWKHCNRYVQNHIQYDAYPPGESPLGYNGFAEIWFNSLEEFNQWQAGHLDDEAVIADEKNLVDKVDTFFTYEVRK